MCFVENTCLFVNSNKNLIIEKIKKGVGQVVVISEHCAFSHRLSSIYIFAIGDSNTDCGKLLSERLIFVH